jgi:hypothetical protein
MSTAHPEPRTMATRVVLDTVPRVEPARHGLTAGALAVTLSVALGACLAGSLLARHGPPPAPKHPASKPHHSAQAPLPAQPDGPRVQGVVSGMNQRDGSLHVRIGDATYLYHVNYATSFPQACLSRDDLRPGMPVTLTLPWYLSGDLYVQAVAPQLDCGSRRRPRQSPVPL